MPLILLLAALFLYEAGAGYWENPDSLLESLLLCGVAAGLLAFWLMKRRR